MFRNYLKIAFRHIVKDKMYSTINIFTLTLGLSCFILFFFSWQYENSYEKYHKNIDNIYCVNYYTSEKGSSGEGTYRSDAATASALNGSVPEIVTAANLTWPEESVIKAYDKYYFENVVSADNGIFDIFTFNFINRSNYAPLKDPNTVVISESIAKKYFGTENPLGKTIITRNRSSIDKYEFTVTGVFKDPPTATYIKFEIITSNINIPNQYYSTFVLLNSNADIKAAGEKIDARLKSVHNPVPYGDPKDYKMYLKPYREFHLYDKTIGQYLFIMGSGAFIVLLLSCINFTNLSIALYLKRIKEIGVRKALGSSKKNLAIQFLSESFLLNIAALLFAIFTISIVTPLLPLNVFKEIVLFENVNFTLIGGLILLLVSVSFISGAYPAFYISRLNPSLILQSGKIHTPGKWHLKKMLLFLQFAILVSLMILTAGMAGQLNYLKKSDLGFDPGNIVLAKAFDVTLFAEGKYVSDKPGNAMYDELKKNPDIKGVSFNVCSPLEGGLKNIVNYQGTDLKGEWSEILANKDFLTTFSIPLVEGRNFIDEDKDAANRGNIIINEKAAKLLGPGPAVGKSVSLYNKMFSKYDQATIIGVVKDFHDRNFHFSINPTFITLNNGIGTETAIKVDGRNVASALSYIKSTWASLHPDVNVKYSFYDEEIERIYLPEFRIGTIIKIFTFIAIIIAVTGLFGLTSLSAEQRKKELGIRKILGASFKDLVLIFLKDFNLPSLLAVAAAIPLGYYFLNKWLDEFAYKTALPLWIYIVIVIISFTIAWATIGIHIYSASRTNPVDNLRYE